MSFAFSANPIDPSTNYLQGKTLSGYPTASNPTYVGTYAEESLLINKAISNPQSQPSAFGDGSGGSLEIVPGQPGNSVVALSTFNDVYAKTTLNVQGGPLQVGIPGVEDTVTIKPGAAGSGQVTIDASSSEVDSDVSIVIEPKGSGAVTIGNTLFQDSLSILPNPVGFNNVTLNAVGPDPNITYTIAPKGTGAINLGQRSNTNAIQVVPGQTGSSAAQINAVGPDTNIDIQIQPKQGGAVTLGNQQSHDVISVVPGASAVNINAVGPDTTIHQNIIPKGIGSVTIGNIGTTDSIQIQPGNSGSSAIAINAIGPDAHIDHNIVPKGTGVVNLGSVNGDLVQIQPGAAGSNNASVSAVGVDANVNLNLNAKGTGQVIANSLALAAGNSFCGSYFPTMLVWAVMDTYMCGSTENTFATGWSVFGGSVDPNKAYSGNTATSVITHKNNSFVLQKNNSAPFFSARYVPLYIGGNAVTNHYFMDGGTDFGKTPPTHFRLIIKASLLTLADGIVSTVFIAVEDTGSDGAPLPQTSANAIGNWNHTSNGGGRGLSTSISPWMTLSSPYSECLNLYTFNAPDDVYVTQVFIQFKN